jgi:hypothetical protein
MIKWEIEDNSHNGYTSACAEAGKMRQFATITLTNDKFCCKLDWEPLDQHAEAVFESLEFAKDWAESWPHKRYCLECKKLHEVVAFCERCKACLYKHGTHLNNPDYPLEKCSECGQVNFWD